MLNRTFLASSVFCLLGLTAVSAQADSSGSLHLSGSIPAVYALEVKADPLAIQLNIAKGESGLEVGRVSESCNSASGYKILLSSANDGRLINHLVPTETIDYQISYDGSALVQPRTQPQTVKVSGTLAQPVVAESAVQITFNGKPKALSGHYQDTLYLEIMAP